jgi:transglutaminase superfamily protein
MTYVPESPDFEPRIADWLERDPDRAPGSVLATVVAAVPAIHQRRRSHAWSGRRISGHVPAAVAAIVILGVGASLIWRSASGPVPGGGDAQAAGAHVPFAATWPVDERTALTIRAAALDGDEYWQAATFDRMTPTGWEQSDTRAVTRPANSPLLDGTIDDPGSRPGFRTVTFTAIPASDTLRQMVSPGPPVTADERVLLTLLGTAGFYGGMERDGTNASAGYRITAQVPVRGLGPGELNAAALRAAGTNYPAEVIAHYLQLDPGAIGPHAAALRDRIVAGARSRTPFDIAQQAETLLRSPEFIYQVDISDLHCAGTSTPECFATYRRGFCVQYATTMAAILRDLGIPTRLVDGFLPGTVSGDVEVIRNAEAHTWVEVYFPGYGWVMFDPTGGSPLRQAAPAVVSTQP